MNLILIIGHTGQGKSTLVKKMIAGKRQYIFDVNNEYSLPPDTGNILPQMRDTTLNVNRFLSVSKKIRNTNIVFEDATGFFRGKQSKELMQQIVAKRHTGNNFIILFHSINRVPPELMEMANFVFLFKTIDNIDIVDKKFKNPVLTKSFLELKNKQQFSHLKIKLI